MMETSPLYQLKPYSLLSQHFAFGNGQEKTAACFAMAISTKSMSCMTRLRIRFLLK